MARYKLVIEYDGAPFVGWQRQTNGRSVQQAIEEAAERLSGAKTRINGAGRTDTGVHAAGQAAHVDFAKAYPADTVRDALNAHLRPEPVAVVAATAVDEAFDARHSATARHYRYLIINRRAPLALEQKAWQVAGTLDEAAMGEGARHLIGRHDFTTFRASQCQAQSPVRTLDMLSVERHSDHIVIGASARSFLHHQVRSIVGSLVEVGLGRWQPRHMGDVLAARSRAACGPVAPAAGLTLTKVDYEDALWT
ncbi:MAG: tRNA pseudouridine(38-40) synthase TruA [Devosia sp.]